MEVSFMADTFSLLRHHLSVTDALQVTSSAVFSVDAVAPPPVRSKPSTARRALLKTRRRTKRRSSPPPDGGDEYGFFAGDGDFGDFGDGGFPGGGSGSGRGWNFDGYGGGFHNWDDDQSSSNNPDDPAFDFVYEVVCWIVFSNCLHFAFKRVVRFVSEEREKIPVRIASVC